MPPNIAHYVSNIERKYSFNTHLYQGSRTFSADWKIGAGPVADGQLSCLVCRDGVWREYQNCSRHERSQRHKSYIGFFDQDRLLHHSEISLTSLSNKGSGESLIAVNQQPTALGPLGYVYCKTQLGLVQLDLTAEETGEDARGSDKGSNDDYDLGSIDLNYTLEDTVDSIIAGKTFVHIEEWLNKGQDIDSDSYSVDTMEDEQGPDFDYLPSK